MPPIMNRGLAEQWISGAWPSVIDAFIATLVTLLALRLIRSWSLHAMDRGRVDAGTRILVRRTLTIIILVIGGGVILGSLGVSPATLVTVVGAVGLAFSLALQDILKNFFSGIYLLLERPFRVGDCIKVKEQQGIVEHIGVRTTMLRTAENVYVLVPNAIVFAEVVSNHTHATPAAALDIETSEARPSADGHASPAMSTPSSTPR